MGGAAGTPRRLVGRQCLSCQVVAAPQAFASGLPGGDRLRLTSKTRKSNASSSKPKANGPDPDRPIAPDGFLFADDPPKRVLAGCDWQEWRNRAGGREKPQVGDT